MAGKANKTDKIIEFEGEILNTASYAHYYCRLPLFTSFRIFNRSESAAQGLTVRISGSTQLILPSEISVEEIPHESGMEISTGNILNPKYLAELSKPENCVVTVKVMCGGSAVCEGSAETCALPIDCFEGLAGNVETLAAFVRPKLADCRKILAEAGLQLKTWGYSSEWSGYAGNDKNAVRNAVAAIYAAIRHNNVERAGDIDLSAMTSAGDISGVIADKRANTLSLALFAASCLEAVKLNPVLALGKNRVGVGVWLYESCFSLPAQDDMSVIEKYVAEGINNLALFDADDLFAHRNASFTTSEAHFKGALSDGAFEVILDIRRSRIGGVFPLPIKVKTASGYELLDEGALSYDSKPKSVIDASKYDLGAAATKDAGWRRRLLDLSMKNNLLNFRFRKDCIHILSPDISDFCRRLPERDRYTILPNAAPIKKAAYFGYCEDVKRMGELIALEMNSGTLRCYSSQEGLSETAATLIRKGRASEEEAGAKTLYIALGFLKWRDGADKEDKFAPLMLLPAELKRTKTQGVTLEAGDGCEVNTTLLEFLKQQFDIDVRGAEGKRLSPEELLAVFRSKTAHMKDWAVYGDIYISQFTFARYAMWADVKNNIEKYRKNPLIDSLLSNTNKLAGNRLSGAGEDGSDPCSIAAPLPCDSTQYAAVAESGKGSTFVLHGPPGTGKSQTITNMIANALFSGKRVLFVAEKQAALQVVKKRLVETGIGEFCLELHSGKADKGEVIRSIESTLSLTASPDDGAYYSAGERIARSRAALSAPHTALHKKRRLGVSVYEGILYYLQNKNAPELVDIESTFYDSLTKSRLEECESMLLTAQAAAGECGGVYRSPFADVNLTECDARASFAVRCAAETVLAELKHLKNYLGLFLDTYNQRVSAFTHKKLEYLMEIVSILKGDGLDKFFTCDEEQFYIFYNANLRYDAESAYWLTRFRTLPDLDIKTAEGIERELDNWGENYRSSKLILGALKRINRCAARPVPEKEETEWLRRACAICDARRKMLTATELGQSFTGLGGSVNDRKRGELLQPLYKLHELCKKVFMDYNADSFNSVCARTAGGIAKPLLGGLYSAAGSFIRSCDNFARTTKALKSDALDCDIFSYYGGKCGALIDNIDMLPAWCRYKATAKKLNDMGLTFMTDAIESGRVSGKQILSSFRKNVYRNFIQTNIPADEALSSFSASVLEESSADFSRLLEEFTRLTREKVRSELISRLPSPETEGSLALELMSFQRSFKANPRGANLRNLFTELPNLMSVVAPCMLMSPITVSQYLPADPGLFDIVIFDEASQIPTCEAVPSLARAKSAVIVGDPKQMPPTSFFISSGADEENPETEDLESVLDDCLALGIPEMHLIWHYRSKHESLIAFSNINYYSGKLCTYPSPDAMDSKVSLKYLENGVYDRGGTKCNAAEAEALVDEVVRRLRDVKLRSSSIGIVTFSMPQQIYIERLLSKRLQKEGLDGAAYEREEPLFVKNLENVQGDERDVVLFSVCYGPDRQGKISLNFGPLNQLGGWRRLNVAVSRAREEMVVFSSMRYSMIDLSRTNSRGVAGLKGFLEFAEKGRANIPVRNDEIIINRQGIGKFVAEELRAYGYDCRCDVGVSDFKIDVAVVDPADRRNFILAILCDGSTAFSTKDRVTVQPQTLKRNNWNVIRLYSINFFNNPKREVKKIKDYLDRLTRGGKSEGAISFKKPYRAAKGEACARPPEYILGGENDGEIIRLLKNIVAAEEPISVNFLIKRALSFYGITRFGTRLEGKLRALISACGFISRTCAGVECLCKSEKRFSFDRYRAEEGAPLRTQDTDFSPYDVISLFKGVLINKVSVYFDELVAIAYKEFKIPRAGERFTAYFNACIDEGVAQGEFIRSVSDKITLA